MTRRRGERAGRGGRPGGDPRRRLSRPRLPGEPGEPISIGDAAALVGEELGLAEPQVFSQVVDAWPEVVGDVLAGHSRVRSVRDGVLEIGVDGPAWATELRYREPDLVDRVSRVLGPGVVTGVRVAVDGPP